MATAAARAVHAAKRPATAPANGSALVVAPPPVRLPPLSGLAKVRAAYRTERGLAGSD